MGLVLLGSGPGAGLVFYQDGVTTLIEPGALGEVLLGLGVTEIPEFGPDPGGGGGGGEVTQAELDDAVAALEASLATKQAAVSAATDAELTAAVDVVNAAIAAHLGDATDAHDASAISLAPTGSVAATDVQAAVAELASEKQDAATAATDAELAAINSALDTRLDSVESSHYVGTLAGRPAATTAGIETAFCTDDNGGTLYVSDGTDWHIAGPRGIELAQTAYTTTDALRGNAGFVQVPSFTISYTARDRPVLVEAHLVFQKDATVGYIWAYVCVDGAPATAPGAGGASIQHVSTASGWATIEPETRISDSPGTVRTLGVAFACGAGQAKLSGGVAVCTLKAIEV